MEPFGLEKDGVLNNGRWAHIKVKVLCWTLWTQVVQTVVQRSPLRPLLLGFRGEPSNGLYLRNQDKWDGMMG